LAGMLGAASFAERAAGRAEAAGDSRSAIAAATATLCECGLVLKVLLQDDVGGRKAEVERGVWSVR
jgi:hypothetical protein